MNLNTFLFVILSCTSIFAQESPSEKILKEIRGRVDLSEKGEKLIWLDSLSNYSYFEVGLKDDLILRETIAHALSLDSINIATWHTVNLINYYNNTKGDPKEGNRIFLDFLETSKSATDYRTLAKFFIEGGDSFYFMKDHQSAIKYLEFSEENALKANNKKFLGLAKLYKGGSQSFLGNFSGASQTLQEATRIFQDTKDTFNLIGARNSLSILYSQNAFFDEAMEERNEAILLAKKIESYDHLTSFYFNAATDAGKQQNSDLRIENLNLALEANEKSRNSNFRTGHLLSSTIIAYAQSDNISKAELYLIEIEKNPEQNTQGRNRGHYLDALKQLAFAKKEYRKALLLGKDHFNLNKDSDDYEDIQGNEKFLAKVYKALGNYQLALIHHKNYTRMKDSISSIQKIKALSYYQTLYETEKRDLRISAQKSDIALLDARNKAKNQWLLFGGLSLLSIFTVVILARARNGARKRNKLNEKFSRDLIKAQEEERTRVARELHDSVGQKLMLLAKQTKSIGNEKMESLAGNTLEELRSISRGLHPAILERLGVTAAIKSIINEVDARTSIFFTNEIDNIDDLLSKEASLHLYRIFQEVLNNMVKHAEAKSAFVTIERKKDFIQATIKDNGIGFELSDKLKQTSSLGMKTLMERAKIIKSTLDIISKNDQGTTIEIVIPV